MATTIGFMTSRVWTTDDVSGYPGAVRKVEWVMQFSDSELYGDHSINSYGEHEFDLSAESLPATEDFVAIADVTDTTIKPWIIAATSDYDAFVTHHEGVLAASYEEYTLVEHSTADPQTDPNFV
jgi:hypothetical protein